jgi:uncharacterized alpha/beta hydrolase family protein
LSRSYWTIIVHGTGGTRESFHRIAHPLEFRRQMEQQVEGHDKLAADSMTAWAAFFRALVV